MRFGLTAVAAMVAIGLAGGMAGCGKSGVSTSTAVDGQAPSPAVATTAGDRQVGAAMPAAAPALVFDPALPLVIEAEAMTAVAPMAVAEDDEASGGKIVRIPMEIPKEAPLTGSLTTTIRVPGEQRVRLWLHVKWAGECSNSFAVKVPGAPEAIVEDSTYSTWHWVKAPDLTLAGEVVLAIGQREPDVAIDQIYLTTDLQYVPMGIEEP